MLDPPPDMHPQDLPHAAQPLTCTPHDILLVFDEVGGLNNTEFPHGDTYSAHPVACADALAQQE